MDFQGLKSNLKAGFAGYINCNIFHKLNLIEDSGVWKSEMFLFEYLGNAHVRNINNNLYVFSTGMSENNINRVINIIETDSILLDEHLSLDHLFENNKSDLIKLLLPGAVLFIIIPEAGRVLCLRDAAGFIPVYYSYSKNFLIFSSNLETVRNQRNFNGINTDIISEMLIFGHRTCHRTLWQGINCIGPGTASIFEYNSSPKTLPIFNINNMFEDKTRKEINSNTKNQLLERIRCKLDESLKPLENHTDICVPCGGGVDSSLLGAYLAKKGHKITYYCINQPDAAINEMQWMKPLSEKLGIPCEYANLNKEVFIRYLVKQIKQTNQPLVGPNQIGGLYARDIALDSGHNIFVSGEGADTLFGGLAPFGRLFLKSYIFRLLSNLPSRLRNQLVRGLINENSWLLDQSLVSPIDSIYSIAIGCLERSELMIKTHDIKNDNNRIQKYADIFSWIQLNEVPSGLNHLFFEKDEFQGGKTYYPFADYELIKFGLNLPYKYKVKKQTKKWLWRCFASEYIGRDVAFRKKYSFPTLTHIWMNSAEKLLKNGFMEELYNTDIYSIYAQLPEKDPSKWTLLNIEIWGRLNVYNESCEELVIKLQDSKNHD